MNEWMVVECAWCDRIATGSAKHTDGVWFASCGRMRGHGPEFERTQRWRSQA